MNEEINLKKFAERFSYLIKNSNIEIPKLAQMLGIKSKSTIYRYMNAEMAPKISTVKYASEIFNVNPLWLMGYDVPMERTPVNSKENKDFRYASYNGEDEELDEEDMKKVEEYVAFLKSQKKNKK